MSKKNYRYIFSIISLLCLVCFLFCPLGGYKEESYVDYSTNGLKLTFGLKEDNYTIFSFNYVGIIIMILLICLAVLPLFIFSKRRKLILILTSIISLISFGLILIFPLTVQHYSSYAKEIFVGLPFDYIIASLLIINCILFVYFYIKFVKTK